MRAHKPLQRQNSAKRQAKTSSLILLSDQNLEGRNVSEILELLQRNDLSNINSPVHKVVHKSICKRNSYEEALQPSTSKNARQQDCSSPVCPPTPTHHARRLKPSLPASYPLEPEQVPSPEIRVADIRPLNHMRYNIRQMELRTSEIRTDADAAESSLADNG